MEKIINDTSKSIPEFSVILPTYNERENLPYVVWLIDDAFKKCNATYEILVVDDASPDGTASVCVSLQRIFGNAKLKLLQRPGKLGLGSAYKDGLNHTKGDFIFLMDADLSHDPKYIPKFIDLQRKHNYDIVSGSRYIPNGGVSGWDLKRIVMSRGANVLAQILLNPRASDLTGSFRLYRRPVLDSIMKDMNPSGYVFQMEIIVRAQNKGYTIGEVPIIFVDRLYGVSKLGTGEIVGYLKGVFRLFWEL